MTAATPVLELKAIDRTYKTSAGSVVVSITINVIDNSLPAI